MTPLELVQGESAHKLWGGAIRWSDLSNYGRG
jgi:hypothetical protein